MEALRFNYVPGSPRPDATRNSPRAILLWEKGKREYEEYEFRKKLAEEQYANREPSTIEEFQQADADSATRARQRALAEAEEDRIYAQGAREKQERLRQQRQEADQQYIRYWEATTPHERTAALIAYARAIRTADGYSGNFASQAAVDKTRASLNSINNCPKSFRTRYRAIRVGPLHENLAERDQLKLVPEDRTAEGRKALLGIWF